MMKRERILAVWLSLCYVYVVALSQPQLQSVPQQKQLGESDQTTQSLLPSKLTVKQGQLIILKANVDTPVAWWIDERLASESECYFDVNNNTVIIPAQKSGEFFVLGWTVKDGKPTKASKVVLYIEATQPSPPTPTPTPTPTPVPPAPVDLFTESLRNAYRLDLADNPRSKEHIEVLRSIYRNGAVFVVQDMGLKTVLDVYQALQRTARVLLADTDLARTRRVVADELNRLITYPPTQLLTEEVRKNIASHFIRIHDSLARVAP